MSPPTVARAENLALIFQELFTAIERLRANRQSVTDAEGFRANILDAVKTAAQTARNVAGYATNDIRMATLAVAGFMDETILTLSNPIFANWPRQTLQQELFGTHRAGEVFFENLSELLGRNDSQDLADVLEVHYLCLLLGYLGRYSQGNRGDLTSYISATAAKIRRIRGVFPGLSPVWQPPAEPVKTAKDAWTRRLLIAAVVSFALMVVLFAFYKLFLNSGASGIQGIPS